MQRPGVLAAGLLVLASAGAQAAFGELHGTVTRVSDGDTLWVRPQSGGRPRPVRIEGIDAPELCQPFGPQAQQALARRVLHRRVAVTVSGRDDYRRLLGRLELDDQDLGRWMVSTGHAWSYRWRADRGPYAVQETQARQAGRGLWAEPGAQEPRRFRREHGSCHADASRPLSR